MTCFAFGLGGEGVEIQENLFIATQSPISHLSLADDPDLMKWYCKHPSPTTHIFSCDEQLKK